MNTLPIIIEDISIRQDDLHKASGGEKRHQPSNWLASQQTIELIAELTIPGIPGIDKIQPVSSNQGIYRSHDPAWECSQGCSSVPAITIT